MSSGDNANALYIGLMSGTSMDGIDAALVRFGDRSCHLVETQTSQYPAELRKELLHTSRTPSGCTVDVIGTLDRWVGECFRDAALALVERAAVDPTAVVAIGSHGQTLRHRPRAERPFTMQIGDPNTIVTGTGITTVADFRRRDLAVGGEGAPLAPAFHRWLFSHPAQSRCVLNLGGIANVTVLPTNNSPVLGFDTGPANTLLDSWARQHLDAEFDHNGDWASSGAVSGALLAQMLSDPYFAAEAPKSTGFEYFNDRWLQEKIAASGLDKVAAADVQATLAELSAQTVATAILQVSASTKEVFACGGGVHNADLIARLRRHLGNITLRTTEAGGLHPDWVEAVAFAWLARCCLASKPGNIPSVTGASESQILGAIYPGSH